MKIEWDQTTFNPSGDPEMFTSNADYYYAALTAELELLPDLDVQGFLRDLDARDEDWQHLTTLERKVHLRNLLVKLNEVRLGREAAE